MWWSPKLRIISFFFLFLLCDMTVKSAVMIRCRYNDQQGHEMNSQVNWLDSTNRL